MWIISALIVFLIGAGFVVAFNPSGTGGDPAVMGHSADEIIVKNSSGNLVSLQTLIDQGGLVRIIFWDL